MENELNPKRAYQKFNLRAGDVFNRLRYTGQTTFIESGGKRRRMIQAQCECGVVKYYDFDIVKRGDVKSCGCYKADLFKVQPNNIIHGLRKHRLYSIWRGIKERCFNPNAKSYKRYGAKGITICDEWANDFLNFYNWSMANGYSDILTIDREKNDKGYFPNNCRYTSYTEQRLNSSQVIWITAWNETKCLSDWAKDNRCAISEKGLRNRFGRDKHKWLISEDAISNSSIPHDVQRINRKNNNILTAFGESKIIPDWVKDSRCTVKEGGIRKRLLKGWPPEKAVSEPLCRIKK